MDNQFDIRVYKGLFSSGTAAPAGRKPTPEEEAGVGVIEPRSKSTCAATPNPSLRSSSGLRDIAAELEADLVFNDFGVSEADIASAAGQDGKYCDFDEFISFVKCIHVHRYC